MAPPRKSSRTGPIVLAGAAIILVVAISYASLRHGGTTPGAKTAMTEVPAPTTVVETLRERVRTAPTDATAWQMLGAAQFDQGLFGEAADAYDHATRLAPGRADLWAALGEARASASVRDPMPAPALAAFRKAISIDPKEPRSHYFLAVARDVAGDHRGAIDDWFALLRDTPPGAPWEQDLRRTIEQVGKINAIDVADRLAAVKPGVAHPAMPQMPTADAAIPGPSAEQMRAAAALPPTQQDAMVQNMVARLEAKLQANPANVDGWLMLMRSRTTLGETAKASAALRDAIAANPGAKARLENEAAALGVPIR